MKKNLRIDQQLRNGCNSDSSETSSEIEQTNLWLIDNDSNLEPLQSGSESESEIWDWSNTNRFPGFSANECARFIQKESEEDEEITDLISGDDEPDKHVNYLR